MILEPILPRRFYLNCPEFRDSQFFLDIHPISSAYPESLFSKRYSGLYRGSWEMLYKLTSFDSAAHSSGETIHSGKIKTGKNCIYSCNSSGRIRFVYSGSYNAPVPNRQDD